MRTEKNRWRNRSRSCRSITTWPKYNLLIENDIAPVITSESLRDRGALVLQTLFDFKIGAKLVDIHKGPAVTMFELELERGINVARINTLQGNLAMALKADPGVRIIAPIPGKASIGIEVPNLEDYTVRLRPILESTEFRAKTWTLPLILGRDGMGNPLVGRPPQYAAFVDRWNDRFPQIGLCQFDHFEFDDLAPAAWK